MKLISSTAFLLSVLAAATSFAQLPDFPAPQKEHQWLEQFVGEWETETQATVAPGQPPLQCKGTMRARMLGGFWAINEWTTNMMGTDVHSVQSIGYDPAKKKYVGTWVDSMFNHLWQYEGTMDDANKILTLEAEGPNFEEPGKTSRYRDVYEFKSKDELAITSLAQDKEGNWVTFMTGTAKRKK